jgi:hypothetical protein
MEFHNNPRILCRVTIACGRMEEQSHNIRRSTGLQAGLQDRKRFKMFSRVRFFFFNPQEWDLTGLDLYNEIQILCM